MAKYILINSVTLVSAGATYVLHEGTTYDETEFSLAEIAGIA